MLPTRRISGPNPGEARDIDQPLVIGREGDLILDDRRASRRHASVRPVPDGVEVEDLGSANGTFVDGTQIDGKVTVTANAVLRIGQTDLKIEVSLPQMTRVSATPDLPRPQVTRVTPTPEPPQPQVTRVTPTPDLPQPQVTRVSRRRDLPAPEVTVARAVQPAGGPPPAPEPPPTPASAAASPSSPPAAPAPGRGRPSPRLLIAIGVAIVVVIVLLVLVLK